MRETFLSHSRSFLQSVVKIDLYVGHLFAKVTRFFLFFLFVFF